MRERKTQRERETSAIVNHIPEFSNATKYTSTLQILHVTLCTAFTIRSSAITLLDLLPNNYSRGTTLRMISYPLAASVSPPSKLIVFRDDDVQIARGAHHLCPRIRRKRPRPSNAHLRDARSSSSWASRTRYTSLSLNSSLPAVSWLFFPSSKRRS